MDIDLTILVQLALLALLVGVLKPLVFAPLLLVIDSRDQKIHGTRAEVDRLDKICRADRDAYQTRMQEARREGLHLREQLRQEGRLEAQRILTTARSRMARALLEARQAAQQEAQVARVALQGQVDAMAAQAVSSLLSSPVGGVSPVGAGRPS